MTGKTPASDQDNAWTRHLNDQLRVHGRGGVVLVSLALHIAGDAVVTAVLRAVAQDTPISDRHDYGALECDGLPVIWAITDTAVHPQIARQLAVMLKDEGGVGT